MPKFSNHKPSGLPGQTRNEAGGVGFTAKTAFEHLVMTIGRPGFSEPSFYGTTKLGQFTRLTLKNGDPLAVHTAGLTTQAVDILKAVVETAEAEPDMLLRLACYARNEMHVRLTPQIILALAAAVPEARAHLRHFTPKIVVRPDEIKEVFAAHRHLLHYDPKKSTENRPWYSGHLPHSLRKALGDSFQRFDERDFLKYWGTGRPTFGDVLLMIYGTDSRGKLYPRKHGKKPWPVDKYLLNWLVHNELPEDETLLPRARAWARMNSYKELTEEAKSDFLAAGVGWEQIASQFPNKVAWEWLATAEETTGGKPRRVMPAMATLRNLANFAKYGISEQAKQAVCRALVGAAGKANILPMRYFSALTMVSDPLFVNALHEAIDKAVTLLPTLPGRTLVVVDTSGSMKTTKVSEKSTMTADVASKMLAAMVYKLSGPGSLLGCVANYYQTAKVSQRSSVMDIVAVLNTISVGGGTSLSQIFTALDSMTEPPDRVILFTDSETWMDPHVPGRPDYNAAKVQKTLESYRQRFGKPFHVHEVHMCEYKTSSMHPDKLVHVFSTYSESVVSMVRTMEGLDPMTVQDDEDVAVVTEAPKTFNIEQFRQKLVELYP